VSAAARSVFAFGVYFTLLGLTLFVAPNALLGLFGLPPTEEVWIRVAGILALAVGFYYLLAARAELAVFFRWSVYARAPVLPLFALLVVLGLAQPRLILFGLLDALGAIWTALALREPRA
jgi:hypothetical protein